MGCFFYGYALSVGRVQNCIKIFCQHYLYKALNFIQIEFHQTFWIDGRCFGSTIFVIFQALYDNFYNDTGELKINWFSNTIKLIFVFCMRIRGYLLFLSMSYRLLVKVNLKIKPHPFKDFCIQFVRAWAMATLWRYGCCRLTEEFE